MWWWIFSPNILYFNIKKWYNTKNKIIGGIIMYIVMLGKPGSGKGTVGKMLTDSLNLTHI